MKTAEDHVKDQFGIWTHEVTGNPMGVVEFADTLNNFFRCCDAEVVMHVVLVAGFSVQ